MGGPGHGPVPSPWGLRQGLAHFSSACEAVGLGQWYSLEINKIINANAQSLSPQIPLQSKTLVSEEKNLKNEFCERI